MLQDYVQAHRCLDLAASRSTGETRESVVRRRDLMEELMSSTQVVEAQCLADEIEAKLPGDLEPLSSHA